VSSPYIVYRKIPLKCKCIFTGGHLKIRYLKERCISAISARVLKGWEKDF
jgi:hypothetical protein